MKKSGRIVNIAILILGVLMIAYYLALGIAVRFGQAQQYLWLVAGLLCIGRSLYWMWADRNGRRPPRWLIITVRSCVAVGLAVVLAGEAFILSAGLRTPTPGLDYIVVLGAKVNGTQPSGALRNRIRVAGEYLQANPETLAVLSGGQGPDEGISEAQCMFENLIAMGIDADRLQLEDQSTDTMENLRFSRALIPEDASVGLVTNNFHIFRALALARNMGWEVEGIPVATSLLSLPHYLMREFIGVGYEWVRGNLSFRQTFSAPGAATATIAPN